MLYIFILIGLVLFIVGSIEYVDCIEGLGLAVSVVSILVSLVVGGGVYNYQASTIDRRLAVLEEQNTTVLAQVEPLVQQALNYESSTYKELKLDVNKLIIFTQMYPELKGNNFLNKQIDIILTNQEEIKQLKLDKASLGAYRFWLWTSKVD